ncbi:MAG: polysaccharide deacetylase family protein [Lachnospiraceae bacterium]|nr:polysaccharide deacetylase family protein [Lachnospiraceae bacterium]
MKWKDKKLPILLGINIILLLINMMFTLETPVKESISAQVAGVTPAESESNVKKKIALTFDDGPHPEYTPMLLDGLKERNVSAAFFLMGKNAEKYPEIVERMYKEGHTIGNHSYSHVQLSEMEELEACKEMTKANEVIKNIIGKTPDYIRPPFGAWSHNLDCITNMIVVLWDVDPLDWKCQNTDLVVKRVVSNVEEDDIILLHDSYETTVEATFQIIDTLEKEGYEFVSLDEIILE